MTSPGNGAVEEAHRVAVIGFPFFAERTAAVLREAGYDARFVRQPGGLRAWPGVIRAILASQLVYAIGSSIERRSPLDLISRARRPIVMHWVGDDVQVAVESWRRGRASERVLRRAIHWADAPWLADELEELGVVATEKPLPVPAVIGSLLPMPAEFRVLLYLPARFLASYDVEGTMQVVRALPHVQFTLVGGYEPETPLPNLENLGFVDGMRDVYARSSAFLRLVRHDGMSHSVIEGLSFGRWVAWSYPLEGVERVADAGEAIAYLSGLARLHAAGDLRSNEAGAAYVAERYDPARVIQAVRSGLDRVFA